MGMFLITNGKIQSLKCSDFGLLNFLYHGQLNNSNSLLNYIEMYQTLCGILLL